MGAIVENFHFFGCEFDIRKVFHSMIKLMSRFSGAILGVLRTSGLLM